jgi:hypothetical protein
VREIGQHPQRMQRVLEDANVKLSSSVASQPPGTVDPLTSYNYMSA